MARLNDTRAITEAGYDAGESHSVRTRKIENGYVVTEDTCNYGTGEYKCREYFTREKPNIRAATVRGRRGAPSEALSDTKTYLRGR